MIPAPMVKAMDTTAAGDVFNGAIAVALNEKMDWKAGGDFCRSGSFNFCYPDGRAVVNPHDGKKWLFNTIFFLKPMYVYS